MADFEYVPCPQCQHKFMVGHEFFRLPDAYCHCPFCGHEFRVGVAAKAAGADATVPPSSRSTEEAAAPLPP